METLSINLNLALNIVHLILLYQVIKLLPQANLQNEPYADAFLHRSRWPDSNETARFPGLISISHRHLHEYRLAQPHKIMAQELKTQRIRN